MLVATLLLWVSCHGWGDRVLEVKTLSWVCAGEEGMHNEGKLALALALVPELGPNRGLEGDESDLRYGWCKW